MAPAPNEAVEIGCCDGRLGLVEASRVDGLSNQQQDEIAERLAGGEDPKPVVAEYLDPSREGLRMFCLQRLERTLERVLPELEPVLDRIPRQCLLQALPTLKRAKPVIDRLVERELE